MKFNPLTNTLLPGGYICTTADCIEHETYTRHQEGDTVTVTITIKFDSYAIRVVTEEEIFKWALHRMDYTGVDTAYSDVKAMCNEAP